MKRAYIVYNGGLGNQMFQYAFGLFLKLKEKNIQIIFDDTLYTKKSYRQLYFNLFNVNEKLTFLKYKPRTSIGFLTRKVLAYLKKAFFIKTIIKQHSPFDYVKLDRINDKTMFIGYWQNYKYVIDIKKTLKHQFSLKMPSLKLSEICKFVVEQKYCAIHVRRGDYLHFHNNSILPIDYYDKAIKIIKDKEPFTKFLIFSDDVEWCKKYFVGKNFYFSNSLGTFSDYEELFIMSKCYSFIIANSSFSWWGAFLSESDCVICPNYKNWRDDFYMPQWHKIEVN